MFFSFVKFLFFQYNQVAYSLIDFGDLNEIEDEMILKNNLLINSLVNLHQIYSNDVIANIQKIVDETNSDSKEGRDAMFVKKLDQIRLKKNNENEFNKLKKQIEFYIVLNGLFYDKYEKINSAKKEKKPYPKFKLNLSYFCEIIYDIPKNIFITMFSYDSLILGILEKLFAKDESLVSYLIKKGMDNALKNISDTTEVFEEFLKSKNYAP